jgi:hypothetical protein
MYARWEVVFGGDHRRSSNGFSAVLSVLSSMPFVVPGI